MYTISSLNEFTHNPKKYSKQENKTSKTKPLSLV